MIDIFKELTLDKQREGKVNFRYNDQRFDLQRKFRRLMKEVYDFGNEIGFFYNEQNPSLTQSIVEINDYFNALTKNLVNDFSVYKKLKIIRKFYKDEKPLNILREIEKQATELLKNLEIKTKLLNSIPAAKSDRDKEAIRKMIQNDCSFTEASDIYKMRQSIVFDESTYDKFGGIGNFTDEEIDNIDKYKAIVNMIYAVHGILCFSFDKECEDIDKAERIYIVDQKRRELEKIIKENESKNEEENELLKKQLQNALKMNSELQEENKNIKKQLQNAPKMYSELKEENKNIKKQLKNQNKLIDELEIKIEELEKNAEENNQQADVKEDMKAAYREIAEKNQVIEVQKLTIESLQNSLATFTDITASDQ